MYNRYHPSLKMKSFLGILSEHESSLIKTRTFYYWKKMNEKELLGYDPDDPFITNKSEFAFLHEEKSARKLLRVYKTLFDCFHGILKSLPAFNKKLRLHKQSIIDTYHSCREFIRAKEFQLITGISSQKINRWENDMYCENSFLSICKSQNPRQLSFEDQLIIADSLKDPENDYLFICDIWAKLLRPGKLKCKLHTFYRYARIACDKLGLRKKKMRNVRNAVIAKSPLSVIHIDSTMIRCLDGGIWYLNIIYDNFSKAILGIKATMNPNSATVRDNLLEVIHLYGLFNKPFALYCDGGPENKGELDVFLSQHPCIRKFITSHANGIYNNMIESFNSRFKKKIIRLLDLTCHQKIPEQLPYLRAVYNNTFLALIGTLSPEEVLSGLIPWKDLWPELKNSIEEAKKERIFINRMNCCNVIK